MGISHFLGVGVLKMQFSPRIFILPGSYPSPSEPPVGHFKDLPFISTLVLDTLVRSREHKKKIVQLPV